MHNDYNSHSSHTRFMRQWYSVDWGRLSFRYGHLSCARKVSSHCKHINTEIYIHLTHVHQGLRNSGGHTLLILTATTTASTPPFPPTLRTCLFDCRYGAMDNWNMGGAMVDAHEGDNCSLANVCHAGTHLNPLTQFGFGLICDLG